MSDLSNPSQFVSIEFAFLVLGLVKFYYPVNYVEEKIIASFYLGLFICDCSEWAAG